MRLRGCGGSCLSQIGCTGGLELFHMWFAGRGLHPTQVVWLRVSEDRIVRILFINQYFPPDSASTAYLLGQLCEDLATDHEIWVLAARPSYNPEVSTYRPVGIHLRHAWSTRFSR